MKNIFKILFSLSVIIMITSCGEEDFVDYPTGDSQKITDPYLLNNTPVVSFQAGTENYEIDLDLINGTRKVTKLNIYSIYSDAVSGNKSNRGLLKSYDIGSDAKTNINELLTYEDLKAGLTVDGASLPASDTELAIGSGWVLSFEGETAEGNLTLGGNINIAVLSVYAGLYKVVESSYFRIGVQSISWTDETRFIGSVDANTFSYNDFWGPFGWGGQSFNFDLNEEDFSLTAPILVDGALFSGNRAVGCHTEPEIFINVPCEGSNVIIPDPEKPEEASGKHVIKLTYGYFTDGSGPREFYEVLEKI